MTDLDMVAETSEGQQELQARAKEAFLGGTADLLDERGLAWHLGAALLCRADRVLSKRSGDWSKRAHALLGEAARLAKAAG